MDTAAAVEEEDDEPSLPKLLAALALGARAVNALPLTDSHPREDDAEDDDEEDGDDDEFAYHMAFPEFASLARSGRENLAALLSEALRSSASGGDDEAEASHSVPEGGYDHDDPVLWERCADACDALLERVESRLGRVTDDVLGRAAVRAREKAAGGYERLMAGLVDMEKPQVVHGFADDVQNDRHTPFVPRVNPDKPHGTTPLDLTPRPGHGLESRFDPNGGAAVPEDVVAPNSHYPHPYRTEIESFECRPWQLEVASVEELGKRGRGGTLRGQDDEEGGDGSGPSSGIWIDTEDDLMALVERLKRERVHEVAIDLEAHSYRSFSGFVCLMQLSVRRPPLGNDNKMNDSQRGRVSSTNTAVETGYDFLIDTLALRSVMNVHLSPLLANPDVVKVMHGADSDIPWLQRDFGLYVVNLFDTGRAARMLSFPSAGLAYLLNRFARFEADKKHQLSDWRQRPLPPDMRAYATSDTLYLLDIYDRLKAELQSHPNPDVSAKAVFDRSRKVCLIRYDKEPFYPSGYKSLLNSKRGRKKTSFTDKQERALAALYDWRDQTARAYDESSQYVCGNNALLRISGNCPQTVTALQGLVNPLPPLVMRCAQEVLEVIQRAVDASSTGTVSGVVLQDKPTSVPAFAFRTEKLASPPEALSPAPRLTSDVGVEGNISPVLETEDLYRQAGWVSPQVDTALTSAGDEESGGSSPENGRDGDKQRRLLGVSEANRNFAASQYTTHSLELDLIRSDANSFDQAGQQNRRGLTADGLGAARTALGESMGLRLPSNEGEREMSVQDECNAAKKKASSIRESMLGERKSLLDLIRPNLTRDFSNEQSYVDESRQENYDGGDDDKELDSGDDEEDAIPKSMKEIYQISNRNRRRTKKVKVPASTKDAEKDRMERMEVDNLSGAEALLASRGGDGSGYFGGGNSKRQRMDPQRECADDAADPGKEEDVALVEKIGWIDDKKEAELMMMQHQEGDDNEADRNRSENNSDSNRKNTVTSLSSSRAGKRGGAGGQKPSSGAARDSSVAPFDYSSIGPIGVYDAKAPPSNNPFFTGATTSGCAVNQSNSAEWRKGGSGGVKGKNKSGSNYAPNHREGSNKTYVYRSGNQK